MDSLLIKEIREAELKECAEVIRRSFATVAEKFDITKESFPNHTSFITQEKLRKYLDLGTMMFGLYKEGELIGFVSLSKESGEAYELRNLAVLPGHRRQGCGKRLIEFCKTKITSLGGNKIRIGIIEEHTVLKNYYAANGFLHTGTENFAHIPFTVGYMEWGE